MHLVTTEYIETEKSQRNKKKCCGRGGLNTQVYMVYVMIAIEEGTIQQPVSTTSAKIGNK